MSENSQNNTIFVGGISWKADEESLQNFFSSFGKVVECKIILDRTTNKSKGYGFITFENEATAQMVKQSKDLFFLGKMMNVGDAVRKQDVNQKPYPTSPHNDLYMKNPLYMQIGYTPYPYYSLNYHQAFFNQYGYPPPFPMLVNNNTLNYPDPSLQGLPYNYQQQISQHQEANIPSYTDYNLPMNQYYDNNNVNQIPYRNDDENYRYQHQQQYQQFQQMMQQHVVYPQQVQQHQQIPIQQQDPQQFHQEQEQQIQQFREQQQKEDETKGKEENNVTTKQDNNQTQDDNNQTKNSDENNNEETPNAN